MVVRGQGPGSSCSRTVSAHALVERADRLEQPARDGGGVELAAPCGEQRHGRRRRTELERHLDVVREPRERLADRRLVVRAERRPVGHVVNAAFLSRRYARYGPGSSSGEPVSRSIVSFGVSFRPSE